MALGGSPSGGSQKDVARFAICSDQALFLQSNSHQTKKPERFVLCGSLLREANSSSVNEGLPICADSGRCLSAFRAHADHSFRGDPPEHFPQGEVTIPQVGMGVEFLDIDPDSNETLLAWIENLCKSR